MAQNSLLTQLADDKGMVGVSRAGDALIVVPVYGHSAKIDGAVIEAGGAVVALPPGAGPVSDVARFGDWIVESSTGKDGTSLRWYSLRSHQWSPLPVSVPERWRAYVVPTEGTLIVVSYEVLTTSAAVPQMKIDLVHADGTVTSGTLPADRWQVPAVNAMSIWTGRERVTYGVESQAESGGLHQPAAYDPATDTYRAFSNPPWVSCKNECFWTSPHQGGDSRVAAWTGTRSFVFTNIGDVDFAALHDVEHDTWERLAAPPIPISQPWIDASSDRVVMISTTDFGPQGAPVGVAAIFDLASRTWTTQRFADVHADPQENVSLCPARLADAVVVQSCQGASQPIAPVALDLATGTWAPASRRQQSQALVDVGGQVTLEQLADALAR